MDERDDARDNGKAMPFEAWDHALKSTCGHFSARPADRRKAVSGHFRHQRINGLDAANFLCDIEMISRSSQDVRSDSSEHIYLFLQMAGTAKMENGDAREVLSPGDLYLLDSTKPVTIRLDGAVAHCLSLHLPRAALLADAGSRIRLSRVVDPESRAAGRLRGHVVGLLTEKAGRSAPRPELTLDMARIAFAVDEAAQDRMLAGATPRARYELALGEIERRGADADMSLVRLAARIGVSPRQLERDFSVFGAGFVRTLRDQRLKLFLDRMKLARRGSRDARITEIALSAGFRDISNFNRAFRSKFGMSPRSFLNERDALS